MKKALNREQIRLLIHFQWVSGVFYADAWRAISNAYGTKTVGRQTVSDWYKKFENEGMQLKDKKHTGRPRKIDRKAILQTI